MWPPVRPLSQSKSSIAGVHILRVFNNNVVLARRGEDDEVVVTGRGIGFQAHQGDEVDETKVVKVFVPADGRDPDHMAELFSAIPAEHVRLTVQAMERAGMDQLLRDKLTLVMALADHLGGAIRRAHDGEVPLYPLAAEVQNLYAEEYRLAVAFVDCLNESLPVPLDPAEAVAFSLHLVNANFTSGDLSYTYQMTGLIQQMIKVVENHHGPGFSLDLVSMGRFITHLRYLFVRIAQHAQLDDASDVIATAIVQTYPEAAACARRLASIVELRLGAELTGNEVAYLALHIVRLGKFR